MGFLGDLLHYFLLVITLGQSTRISNTVARLLGYEDCGCDKRRDRLNNLWVKKENRTVTL